MKEIWKPLIYPKINGELEDYTGYYEISNLEQVRNCRTGQVLNKVITNGYYQVTLSVHSKINPVVIHRPMAYAFIPNPNNYPYVDHKDGNRLNNYIDIDNPDNSNLRWVTPKMNYNNPNTVKKQNQWKKGHIPHNKGKQFTQICGNNHWNHKPVLQYDLNGNFIKEWISASEVQKELGISQSAISACCRNKYGYKTAGGYIWKFKETV